MRIWLPDLEHAASDILCGGGDIGAPVVQRGTLASFRAGDDEYINAHVWGFDESRISAMDILERAIRFGERVDRAIEEMRLPVASTPQGIASAIVRDAVREANARTDWMCDDAIHLFRRLRSAYLGGHTGVIRTWHEGMVSKIDRNSSYPAEIARGVPALYRPGNPSDGIHPDGIYCATVDVPDSILPPLQRRTYPSGLIVTPTGQFSGIWCGCEILDAVENDGVKILQVHQCWIPSAEIQFPRIPELFQLRGKFAWLKKVLNSMAGMLGKREFTTTYRIGEIPQGWHALTRDGLEIAWRDVWGISRNAQPGGAAIINARARVALKKIMREIGHERVLYVDTDSVAFAGDVPQSIQISGELGGWKLERVADRYSCHALRRIRWNGDASPPDIQAGEMIGGRILCGRWTIPGTIDELHSRTKNMPARPRIEHPLERYMPGE